MSDSKVRHRKPLSGGPAAAGSAGENLADKARQGKVF